jgi:glycosyltransferase involved in cell wall biosynthesis
MRVVVVQDYLRMGGTERQTLFLCEELLRSGHDAHLLIFRPGGCLWEEMLAKGIPHTTLQDFDTGICMLAPGLLDNLERLRPEVVLCMGRTANCFSGFIQYHLPDSKVVGTLRTGKVVFPLHYWSLGKVSAVLVNSNWWKRRMLERGFQPEKIKVIHNPLMLRIGPDDRAKWRNIVRAKTGASDNTCVFLDVAALRPGKRHAELINAFGEFAKKTSTDWQLWLVGTGSEIKTCRGKVHDLGLENRIHFFGLQPKTGAYYAGADAAVSASREDSLPNFLIEAQAMGLPLVAVDCRGVAECCIPGKTGIIIPPDNLEAFSTALEKIASEKKLRQNAAAISPTFAQEKFGAARQASLTISFLEELALGETYNAG